MRRTASILFVLCLCASNGISQSCPLGVSGTFTIGPAGAVYPSLTAAIIDLDAKGLTGPVVLELQSGYTSNAESFPIVLNALPCAGPANTITIRPAAGAPLLSITGNNDSTLLYINGGSYYILDGRPGGSGAAKALSISNANDTGSAIRLINGASRNELEHLDVRGTSTNYFAGIIQLGAAGASPGNNYNRIDSCDIHAGATYPYFGILAADDGGTKNWGNTVADCNIYNIACTDQYGIPYAAKAIGFGDGYDSVTITGNSVYQTADFTFSPPPPYFGTTYPFTAISVGSRNDGGHTVTGNFIGGTQPHAAGTPMIVTVSNQFTGIKVACPSGAGMASLVNDNTVTNMTWQGTPMTIDVMIDMGGFNGSCHNNIIGNKGPGYSLQRLGPPAYNNFSLSGIHLASANNSFQDVTGNYIGGIMTDSFVISSITGIDLNGPSVPGGLTVQNNQVGDDSTANSIWVQNGYATGIYILDGSDSLVDSLAILDNHVANLNSGATKGIFYFGGMAGTPKISGNTIHDLSNISKAGSLTGIFIEYDEIYPYPRGSRLLCNNNRIGGLSYTGAQQIEVDGIALTALAQAFAPRVQIAISGNFVSGVYQSNGPVYGIKTDPQFEGAIDNNMIDLGLTPDGTPVPLSDTTRSPTGIYGYGHFDFLHNSVYMHAVKGNNYDGTGICLAAGDTSQIVIANNILEQDLTGNAGGLSLIALPIGPNPNIVCDYNLYCFPGIGNTGSIGRGGNLIYNQPVSTLTTWQVASGKDLHSQFDDPLFIQPIAAWSNVDLHLRPGSPAESAGTPAFTTLTDIDGKIRAQWTPVDIGADAGNFKIPGADLDSIQRNDSITFVKAYPNPFSSTLTLDIDAQQTSTAAISIFSESGTLVWSTQTPVTRGHNIVYLTPVTLPNAIYVVQVDLDGRKKSILLLRKR